MRNLKDLAHQIASGEEVGKTELSATAGISRQSLSGGWCLIMQQNLPASLLFCLWAGLLHSVLVCLVCQRGLIQYRFKGM